MLNMCVDEMTAYLDNGEGKGYEIVKDFERVIYQMDKYGIGHDDLMTIDRYPELLEAVESRPDKSGSDKSGSDKEDKVALRTANLNEMLGMCVDEMTAYLDNGEGKGYEIVKDFERVVYKMDKYGIVHDDLMTIDRYPELLEAVESRTDKSGSDKEPKIKGTKSGSDKSGSDKEDKVALRTANLNEMLGMCVDEMTAYLDNGEGKGYEIVKDFERVVYKMDKYGIVHDDLMTIDRYPELLEAVEAECKSSDSDC